MSEAIRVERLTKLYARFAARRRFATLKSALLGGRLFADLEPTERLTALDDVSFRVRAGSTVAVIGPNGSGKSTLLKVIAGILAPTSGRVEVQGRVAALIELGAGFHPEVSGRENVVINGIMLGLGRREIERRLPEIVRFAELEEFIDAPVKTYSSGMYVRLGFSVAVAVDPDVLLVDEVLAVGDEAFSHKCLDRFRDLKRRGCTILLVTHALELAEGLADEIVLIEGGRLTGQGMPREIIDRYRGNVEAREIAAANAANAERVRTEVREEHAPAVSPTPATSAEPDLPDTWRPRRWGNQAVEIASIALRGEDGTERVHFRTGEDVAVEMDVVAHEPQTDFVFGIGVFGRDGRLAYGTNTHIDGLVPRRLEGRARVRARLRKLALLEGSYSLDVAVHKRDGTSFDYRHACISFAVRSDRKDVGVARLAHDWELEGGARMAPAEPRPDRA